MGSKTKTLEHFAQATEGHPLAKAMFTMTSACDKADIPMNDFLNATCQLMLINFEATFDTIAGDNYPEREDDLVSLSKGISKMVLDLKDIMERIGKEL